MGQRGRKPRSELTVRPQIPVALAVRRLEAPDYLSEEARAEWRAVVESLPADHFSRAAQPMLEAYCRHAVSTREIDQRIQALNGEATLTDYNRLLNMHAAEARCLATIGVRLGIACASRLTSAKPIQGVTNRLWERD